jgi:hypothetical protein
VRPVPVRAAPDAVGREFLTDRGLLRRVDRGEAIFLTTTTRQHDGGQVRGQAAGLGDEVIPHIPPFRVRVDA